MNNGNNNWRSIGPARIGRTVAACLFSGLLMLGGCTVTEMQPPGGPGGPGGSTGGGAGSGGATAGVAGSTGGASVGGTSGTSAGGSGGSSAAGSGGSSAAGSGGSSAAGSGGAAGSAGCSRGECRGGTSGAAGGRDGGETADLTVGREASAGAAGGRGGSGGMANDLPAQCQRYCDCMSGHSQSDCKSRTPANCMNTCMQQGRNWDLSCRIDKCVKAKTDYKDQILGDCKAAIGDQACFDIE
jgi:hypothetical protein